MPITQTKLTIPVESGTSGLQFGPEGSTLIVDSADSRQLKYLSAAGTVQTVASVGSPTLTTPILTTPAITGIATETNAGLATTSTDGIVLQNSTAATGGATVQYSPRLRWRGTAWDNAASETLDFWAETIPSASASPFSTWRLQSSLNGASAVTALSVRSDGLVTTVGDLVQGAAAQLYWSGRSILTSPADGQFNITNNFPSAGVGLDVATDSVLKVRTRAQTGYGSVDALAYRINGGAGAATSASKVVKNVTAIADNTATTVLTITVPNAAHAAIVKVTLLGSLGAGGAVGAFETSNVIEGRVVITRVSGVASVATAATAGLTGTAASVGAATLTFAYSIANGSEGVGVSNTHTIQVTIARGSGTSANHSCFVMAEVMNVNGTGITIA